MTFHSPPTPHHAKPFPSYFMQVSWEKQLLDTSTRVKFSSSHLNKNNNNKRSCSLHRREKIKVLQYLPSLSTPFFGRTEKTQTWLGWTIGYSLILWYSSGQPREPWVHGYLYKHKCIEKLYLSTSYSTALILQRLVSSLCFIAILFRE